MEFWFLPYSKALRKRKMHKTKFWRIVCKTRLVGACVACFWEKLSISNTGWRGRGLAQCWPMLSYLVNRLRTSAQEANAKQAKWQYYPLSFFRQVCASCGLLIYVSMALLCYANMFFLVHKTNKKKMGVRTEELKVDLENNKKEWDLSVLLIMRGSL